MGKYELMYNILALKKSEKRFQFNLTFSANEEGQLPEVTGDMLIKLCASLGYTGEVCIEKQLAVSGTWEDGDEAVFLIKPDGSYENVE